MSIPLASLITGSALWYASRATGVVSLVLFTLVSVLGVVINRQGRLPGLPRFVVTGLHRSLSLMAVVFLVVHVVTALSDRYVTIQLIAVVVPLASSYEAVWVGLGAVALDVLVVVILTSLVRGRMPVAAWRVIHWMSYAAYPVMMLHSVFSAQDMQSGVFLGVAVVCTVAMALAVAYRCGCALAEVSQWQRVAVLLDGGRDRSAYRPRPRGGRRR